MLSRVEECSRYPFPQFSLANPRDINSWTIPKVLKKNLITRGRIKGTGRVQRPDGTGEMKPRKQGKWQVDGNLGWFLSSLNEQSLNNQYFLTGLQALKELGIEIELYCASEIDENAVQVSLYNLQFFYSLWWRANAVCNLSMVVIWPSSTCLIVKFANSWTVTISLSKSGRTLDLLLCGIIGKGVLDPAALVHKFSPF